MAPEVVKCVVKKNYPVKISKIFSSVKISRYCFCFTLQQGTIFVAVMELALAIFALILLMLAIAHERNIQDMISDEIKQLPLLPLTKETSAGFPSDIARNEEKLFGALQVTTIFLLCFCIGFSLIVFHIFSSSLLLYGAIQSFPQFLLPWTYSALIQLIFETVFAVSLLFIIPSIKCKILAIILTAPFLTVGFYSWITVVSHYQEIKY